MILSKIKISGAEALETLKHLRSQYPQTGIYPFMIGDQEELERVEENTEFANSEPEQIIQSSLTFDPSKWMAARKEEMAEDGIVTEDTVGKWPGEIHDKGSIGLHKDIVSGQLKRELYFGLATIEKPWHLPAVLNYGGWNDCPEAGIQCAVHRKWQEEYGAEITGMSGDVVECIVARPPTNREAAIRLAWEQYWYCADIVDQGCGSVANLAATLLNSPYWYFWWD
jgi:hypothetical protein